MRKFLKKNIKPFLVFIGCYSFAYRLYFFLLYSNTKLINFFSKTFSKTAPILLYHRITKISNDPNMLCVSPEYFETHLRFLKKNYKVIPLSKLSGELIAGTITGREAAITFDDGYQDNLTNALPLLEKYNLPATIFITTSSLGKRASYEWDMEYKETDRANFLSETEIKALSSHPLIEIGAHTLTHPRLIDLDPKEQRIQIERSKTALEQITGKRISSFAYPFGGYSDFDKTSERIVEELGFDFGYSNTQRFARKTKNRFCIPRINIREYDEKTFSNILNPL
ncbi:MAG: polysaccharide deacetylase family protein [Candidatus Pacebacteria bacterium]|nr:polysaccharide deacetylase family protein [Candidatus Paceibacterota bacterium]MDD5356536.1 polysaccharide deacetylase family protein [Candidatus Paceibacterota bacterium]